MPHVCSQELMLLAMAVPFVGFGLMKAKAFVKSVLRLKK